jgi:hypothetical protein
MSILVPIYYAWTIVLFLYHILFLSISEFKIAKRCKNPEIHSTNFHCRQRIKSHYVPSHYSLPTFDVHFRTVLTDMTRDKTEFAVIWDVTPCSFSEHLMEAIPLFWLLNKHTFESNTTQVYYNSLCLSLGHKQSCQYTSISPPPPQNISWPSISNRIPRRKIWKRRQDATGIIRKPQKNYFTKSHYD